MEKELKKKYTGFIYAYIGNKVVCLSGMMIANGYDEKFFNDAVKDNILIELKTNKNDDQRKFKFTEFAKNFLE